MLLSRDKIAFYLDDFTTTLGLIFNGIILGFIFLSLVIFVAETYPLSSNVKLYLHQLDLAILFIFSIEYLIRFWCADSKLKFIFSLVSIIDLIAIIPLLFGFIDVRFIRIFHGFRILRLVRFIDFEIFIFRIKTEDSVILVRVLLTLFSLIFINSGLIYQIEHHLNPDGFRNFFDALYFSVVTMTTVGFGDVTPLSDTGKFVTLLMICSGVLILPWQIGQLIKQLVKTANQATNQVKKVCSSCGLSLHDPDANFCKICGLPLPNSTNIGG